MPTRITYVPDAPEPVSLDDAKLAARVDVDELDDMIVGLIAAAREQAEHITGRCYRPQVLREELADWPDVSDAIAVHAATACVVRYWAGSEFIELASNAYVFAPGGIGNNGTVLVPALGTIWPALADRAAGPRVQIDLTAGLASVAEQVRLYIKAQVAAWLNNPEALAHKDFQCSPLFERLLDAQRLWC